jgi:peptidoglycan/LPS O-acetylase OafA/YrhL
MQQLLVIWGLGSMNPVVFAVISAFVTVPLAALSWFLVEKPSLSLKSRLERRSVGRGPSACVDNPALAQNLWFQVDSVPIGRVWITLPAG